MDDTLGLWEAYPASLNSEAVGQTENDTTSLEQDTVKQGITNERSRVQGILSHDEANARTLLAQHLAFETDMEVEAAVSVLSKAPLETPTRDDVSGFSAAMEATPNPEITPSPETEDDSEEAVAKRLATY